MNFAARKLLCSLLIFSLFPLSLCARPFILVLSQDDLLNTPTSPDDSPPAADSAPNESPDWDEFGDSDAAQSEEELDPGSWRPIFEPDPFKADPATHPDDGYYSTVSKLIKSVSSGDTALMDAAVSEIEDSASRGLPHARSFLGFLYGTGQMRKQNKAKAFTYHYFAAEGGNMQSKMALAYTYFRQDMFDKAVKLYSELAEAAVNSFLISRDSPVIEAVRIHSGAEENKEALRKSRGEEDEDFQILEYQAQKGNSAAMYKVGLFYYFGLRGLRRDHAKALSWFLKALEKGEPRAMELLGEIYARGAGVERNYTKALEWLTLAAKQDHYSAYNGMGYLYVKGYGVGKKNYTKAKEYFEKAADNQEGGGHYNLGGWLPPSGVQVGSVYNGLGDPTTPGWASTEECERLSDDEVEKSGDVPLIPSLPISAVDGETILRSIGGPVADEDWQGSEDAPTYNVGPGPGIVHLSYTGKQVIGRIENVIGVIEGAEEPDRLVILGNHRDAWTFGAVDPNSGTAALLEVAQRLGKLQKKGWKPRRTIVLCNWDAEEYGLIGSTEWVEENREMLASRAIAYLNVDSGVHGPGFFASATPQLDELLKKATQQVKDPDNSSQTLYQSWVGSRTSPKIDRLGSAGSDFAAFVHHLGIPATHMAFGEGYPVYHSMYDDFIWVKKFGDPMFHRHVAVASVWGLVTLWLADAELLPFNYLSYAMELQTYANDLEDDISDTNINLTPLLKSIEELKRAATEINNERKEIEQNKGWQLTWKKDHVKVRELNDRLMMAERAFTDQDGLFGRSWYKHLIYGPSKYDDYASESFPGIYDAIAKAKTSNTAESWKFVQHEVYRVSRAVKHASQIINGELT